MTPSGKVMQDKNRLEEKREEENRLEEKREENKKTPRKRVTALRPNDVSESVWDDYLQIRKAKKSPLTQTALDGLKREADKAGISLEQALTLCCERGWAGFKAEWIERDTVTTAISAQVNHSDIDDVFHEYSEGMREVYGDNVAPAKSAKVMDSLKKMIDRLGFENSLMVARNFPKHKKSYYVSRVHDVSLMLNDCESLLVQLQGGHMITNALASMQDREGEMLNSMAQFRKRPDSLEAF
jgi:hypothetical protein